MITVISVSGLNFEVIAKIYAKPTRNIVTTLIKGLEGMYVKAQARISRGMSEKECPRLRFRGSEFILTTSSI